MIILKVTSFLKWHKSETRGTSNITSSFFNMFTQEGGGEGIGDSN
jgi:hypothetical protein